MDRLQKLSSLRSLIASGGVDFLIIPSTGPNFNDQVPDHWKVIRWLTGFTGSNAVVIVSQSFAGLWTDPRYYLQAKKQLSGSGFDLMFPGILQSPDYIEWMAENFSDGDTIGFDGRILSIADFRKIKIRLKNRSLKYVSDCDLISGIWTDRPDLPGSEAWDHPVRFSGKERSSKLSEVMEKMRKRSVEHHLLTSPEDIMWLLNIRGNDLDFTPVILSYFLISEETSVLFSGTGKITSGLAEEFSRLNIQVADSNCISGILSSLKEGSSILISPDTTSVALYNSISESVKIVEDVSIPGRMKAIKNPVEIKNIQEVMIRDGVALTKFFFWLENNIGNREMTELSTVSKLQELRKKQTDYLGPSFQTISAFNENSAFPHYETGTGLKSHIGGNGILLIDSGGQYLGGTTDITRTIAIGTPTGKQRRDFTLILKGHIALAAAKFPAGTSGYQLDLLARKALWEHGINYGHGTGHGVGFCLNVHEGPQSISPAANKTPIEAGMLLSNEPAIYREGEYGIRTENLMICYEDEETEFGRFMKFDTMSLCYIDTNLIDKSLLTDHEIGWLDRYHEEVYDKIAAYLEEEEKVWLRSKTDPV
jgi:Xaa-Pro aminopeptidase